MQTPATIQCDNCGWCCRTFPISVTYSDLIKWLGRGRKDILREISFINNYPKKRQGVFFIAKTTFNPKQPCPFLNKQNLCDIHDVKPTTCKNFPLGRAKYPECVISQYRQLTADEFVELKQKLQKDFQKALDHKGRLIQALVLARE